MCKLRDVVRSLMVLVLTKNWKLVYPSSVRDMLLDFITIYYSSKKFVDHKSIRRPDC